MSRQRQLSRRLKNLPIPDPIQSVVQDKHGVKRKITPRAPTKAKKSKEREVNLTKFPKERDNMKPAISIQEECSISSCTTSKFQKTNDFRPPIFSSLSQPFIGKEMQRSINQLLRTWQPPLKANNEDAIPKNFNNLESFQLPINKQNNSPATNHAFSTNVSMETLQNAQDFQEHNGITDDKPAKEFIHINEKMASLTGKGLLESIAQNTSSAVQNALGHDITETKTKRCTETHKVIETLITHDKNSDAELINKNSSPNEDCGNLKKKYCDMSKGSESEKQEIQIRNTSNTLPGLSGDDKDILGSYQSFSRSSQDKEKTEYCNKEVSFAMKSDFKKCSGSLNKTSDDNLPLTSPNILLPSTPTTDLQSTPTSNLQSTPTSNFQSTPTSNLQSTPTSNLQSTPLKSKAPLISPNDLLPSILPTNLLQSTPPNNIPPSESSTNLSLTDHPPSTPPTNLLPSAPETPPTIKIEINSGCTAYSKEYNADTCSTTHKKVIFNGLEVQDTTAQSESHKQANENDSLNTQPDELAHPYNVCRDEKPQHFQLTRNKTTTKIQTELSSLNNNVGNDANQLVSSVCNLNAEEGLKQDFITYTAQSFSETSLPSRADPSQLTNIQTHHEIKILNGSSKESERECISSINDIRENKRMWDNISEQIHEKQMTKGIISEDKPSSTLHNLQLGTYHSFQSNNSSQKYNKEIDFKPQHEEKQNNSIYGNGLSMEEEFDISHSQLASIEDECNQNVSIKVRHTGKTDSQSTVLTSDRILKPRKPQVDWVQRLQENKKQLRTIIQEISRLNAMLTKVRREVWPSKMFKAP